MYANTPRRNDDVFVGNQPYPRGFRAIHYPAALLVGAVPMVLISSSRLAGITNCPGTRRGGGIEMGSTLGQEVAEEIFE